MEIRQTDVFADWLHGLRDARAKARIVSRIDRLAIGHAGDAQPVGEGVSELRIHHGPGYRVYFARKRNVLILLLCGGDKGTQQRDIRIARELAKQIGKEDDDGNETV